MTLVEVSRTKCRRTKKKVDEVSPNQSFALSHEHTFSYLFYLLFFPPWSLKKILSDLLLQFMFNCKPFFIGVYARSQGAKRKLVFSFIRLFIYKISLRGFGQMCCGICCVAAHGGDSKITFVALCLTSP